MGVWGRKRVLRGGQAYRASSRILAPVILIALIASLSTICADNADARLTNVDLATSAVYTTRVPIRINDVSEFTLGNGVVSGNGTAENPYVIEGWEIDASEGDGVVVTDIATHFVIRNCHIHEGFYAMNHGIVLTNCTNCIVENNLCEDNRCGILVALCNGITITDNSCTANDESNIRVSSSDNVTVRDNICDMSFEENGIQLHNSCGNIIEDNVCGINELNGVSLAGDSCFNTITGNKLSENYEYGVSLASSSCNNTIWNNTFIDNNDAGNEYIINCAQAFDEGYSNNWYAIVTLNGSGNYWSDWCSPDSDRDGIVDDSYVIDPIRGIEDPYPLSIPPSSLEEEEVSESDAVLIGGVAIAAIAIVAAAVLVILVMKKGEDSRRGGTATATKTHRELTTAAGARTFCSHCGHPIAPDGAWCPRCGMRYDAGRKT